MNKERYEKKKARLLNDNTICKENRDLFKEFFDYQEYKLKRMRNLPSLDTANYKTLYGYATKFGNINKWFNNKPLRSITRADIKKVYDDLEDGTIKNNRNGKRHSDTSRTTYYNKIFKSKLFELAGKQDLAREVMEFSGKNDDKQVRFIREDIFRQIAAVMIMPEHKLLTWLIWDLSENINFWLQTRKKDYIRKIDTDTNEPEYHVIMRKELLKRSRRPRTEITNYRETVEFLDIVLKDKDDDDCVFNFAYRNGKKILDRAVDITGARCEPNGEKVSWKDLRSSCACNLLLKGWTRDEINARLGHTPSSTEIDKYINFLAIDRKKPQKKVYEGNLAKLNDELNRTKELEKLQKQRVEELQNQMNEMKAKFALLDKFEEFINLQKTKTTKVN